MGRLFKRMRDAFAQYSGLITLAGIAMMIVFGTKYIEHRNTLDGASPETSMPALVKQVTPMTCVKSMSTSIQAFNAKQRCLEVIADLGEGAARKAGQRIVVEENTVGSLAAGDHVYVLPAVSGVNGYLIIDAHDRLGFFLRQYSAAGFALLGMLMIALSFALRRSQREP
ncbi:MAG TPA: hypothetical protein VH105_17315 [Burkholderiales bacterium]|jgi:hypothetical protein|nr:hypothetical protein [Burkholderiales bacterium]